MRISSVTVSGFRFCVMQTRNWTGRSACWMSGHWQPEKADRIVPAVLRNGIQGLSVTVGDALGNPWQEDGLVASGAKRFLWQVARQQVRAVGFQQQAVEGNIVRQRL